MLSLLPCLLVLAPASDVASRPNVLLVTIDTLRADRVGAYGFPLARTPVIDSLAKQGVLCTDAATVAPITLPAHSSILTGLAPPSHGVRDNGAYALGDEVETLAERLRAAGYCTQAFVSAAVLDKRYNLGQGFEGYDDDLSAEDDPKLFMIRDRPAPRTAQRVVAWLERWAKTEPHAPFFVWTHFFDPHQPLEPHTAYAPLLPSLYDAEITSADAGLGALLDALRRLGALDNTIVVLTADHGESLGEHEEITHGIFIYDATIHVPLIWRFPRLLPHGTRYDGPVSAVDITPTLLGLLGFAVPADLDGADLSQPLRGVAPAPERPQYCESLLAEGGFGLAPLVGVRLRGHKLIRAPRPELYDLRADPGELENRVREDTAMAEALRASLIGLESSFAAKKKPARQSPLDQETLAMLQALGYLAPAETRRDLAGLDPKDGIALYAKLEDARHLGQRGAWADAKREILEILATTPNNVSARNILALSLLKLGAPAEAEQEYKNSLAVDPRQHRVHALLGRAALARGSLDEAERHIKTALELAPGFADGLGMLGLVALVRGRADEGEAIFARALAMDSSFAQFFKFIGDYFYERQEYARALDFYERLLARLPEHYSGLVQAALASRHLAQPGRAELYLELAAVARPEAWVPLFNRAWLEAQWGGPSEAVPLLFEAVDRGLSSANLLRDDADWGGVRAQPEWPALLVSIEANQKERGGMARMRAQGAIRR